MKRMLILPLLAIAIDFPFTVRASKQPTYPNAVPVRDALKSTRRRIAKLVGDDTYNPYGGDLKAGNIGDICGHSVDISNDGRNILVGCPHTNVTTNGTSLVEAGSVDLYRLISDENGLVSDYWSKVGSIFGTHAKAEAGISVSMANNQKVIAFGEPFFNNSQGRVRIFKIGGTYLEPTFDPLGEAIEGSESGDRFGFDIDLSDDGMVLIVGATQNAQGDGYAKVFKFDGLQWSMSASLEGSKTTGERFGIAVSISGAGDKVAVGASHYLAGRAVVFDLDGASPIFDITGTVNTIERLGRSVALSDDGNALAVGSVRYDCPAFQVDCGRVQVFDLAKKQKVGNGTDLVGSVNDRCGISIDLSNFSQNSGTVVVGCMAKVLIGSFDGGGFALKSFQSSAPNNVNDFFGRSVALSNVRQALVVGAPGLKQHPVDESATIIGSVYTFGNPVEATLSPSEMPSLQPSMSSSPTMSNTTRIPTIEPTATPTKSPTKPTVPSVGEGKSKGKGKKKWKGKEGKGKLYKEKKKSKGKGKKGDYQKQSKGKGMKGKKRI